jgi:hypothetical protein
MLASSTVPSRSRCAATSELGRRAEFLDGQLDRLDELIVPLVTARTPGLLQLYGVGPDTAAMLLIAAGDNPARLRSEAAWARSGQAGGEHRLLPPSRIQHGLRVSSLSSSTAVARIARISRDAVAAMVPDSPRLISSARHWRTA